MSFKSDTFEIVKSTKAGLESEESWLVVRGTTSYLRILGQEPSWTLMTATANEDSGSVTVCEDRRRLIGAAIRLCRTLGLSPNETKDWIGRDYVNICRIVRIGYDLQSEVEQTIKKFFELFDDGDDSASSLGREMVELYEAISSDENGGDVYLSDGVWLGSDGSLQDRGR